MSEFLQFESGAQQYQEVGLYPPLFYRAPWTAKTSCDHLAYYFIAGGISKLYVSLPA